jgi:hypothetical protein
MNGFAGGEIKPVEGLAHDSGDQRRTTAIEANRDGCGRRGQRIGPADLRDTSGQDVQGAQAFRRCEAQHDVAGSHIGAGRRSGRKVQTGYLEGAGGGREDRQAVGLVVPLHPSLQRRAALVSIERGQVEPSEHVRGRADGRYPAGLQHDDGRGEPRHFADGVRDVHDRHRRLVAQSLDVGQDLGLAGLVQGGQGLVHEEQAWMGQERPADRHPLLLPAGQPGRPALEEVADAEKRDHGVEVAPLARGPRALAACEPAPEEQVLPHGEVREQTPLLEHVADPPPVLGHEDASRRVEEGRALHHDPPPLRSDQARDRIDQRGLAGAGAAEKRGQRPLRPERALEAERP